MNTSSKVRDQQYINEMRHKALSVSSHITLNNTPKTLWAFISNTDLINKKMGLAPTSNSFTPTPNGDTHMHVEFKNMGMTMAYEELPFEWVAPHFLSVERLFTKGPFLYLALNVQLIKTTNRKTELTCELKYLTKFANGLFKKVIQQNLNQILRVYKDIDKKATPKPPIGAETFLEPLEAHIESIHQLFQQWKHLEDESSRKEDDIDSLLKSWDNDDNQEAIDAPPTSQTPIAKCMAEFIFRAPDRFLTKLRPFEVAQMYELDRLATLKFCLGATEEGYLNMSWDLLCPSCKGPKERNSSMKTINAKAHCDACAIDYEIKFDENVELTFSPTAKIKPIHNYAFCAGSPANTTHIIAQINLPSQESKEIKVYLHPGRYRFRALTMENTLEFDVIENANNSHSLHLEQSFPALNLELAPDLSLKLTNHMDYLQTFKLEKMAWKDNIVTAALATSLQDFRDRFSSEVLQPGLQLAISNLVILFTDLKDSTLIYDTHGDASAFNLVQTHFDMLLPILRDYDGALVKTIGDAIMAVFQTELATLKACFEIQRQFKQFNQDKEKDKQAIIKIGFHMGPCIALNLNDKLDYFGATVNKAARIQGKSVGDDICMTDEIYRLPDIQNFLKQHPHQVESFSATLKGIAGESTIYKVTPTF